MTRCKAKVRTPGWVPGANTGRYTEVAADVSEGLRCHLSGDHDGYCWVHRQRPEVVAKLARVNVRATGAVR